MFCFVFPSETLTPLLGLLWQQSLAKQITCFWNPHPLSLRSTRWQLGRLFARRLDPPSSSSDSSLWSLGCFVPAYKGIMGVWLNQGTLLSFPELIFRAKLAGTLGEQSRDSACYPSSSCCLFLARAERSAAMKMQGGLGAGSRE